MASTPTRLRLTVLGTILAVGMTGAGLPTAAIAQSPAPIALPDLTLPDEASLAADARLVVPDAPEPATGATDLDEAIDDALATADALPDREWEVDALAESLGDDPMAAFRVLRDRIRFEPYPGALRGVAGTLAARAGNAWDRALLLKGLLDAMGATSRFAFGELDDPTARVLLDHALDPAADPFPEAGGLAATTFDLGALADRARRDHALLRSAADAAGLVLGGAESPGSLADVRPHAWVQLAQDGGWTDLDPSLPAAEPGRRLTEPTATADTIPDDAWQRLGLRVEVEHLADGVPVGEVVLERQLTAADAADAEVFLYFVPETGGGGLLGGPGGGGSVPVLIVDREVQQGTAFDVSEGGEDDFFGLGGAGGPALTGVWLTAVRDAPGVEPLTTRIPILDRVPSEAREAGTVTPEVLAPMATGDDGPVALGAISHLVVSTGGASPREAALARAAAISFVGSGLLEEGVAADYAPGDVLWPIAVADRLVALASERVLVPAVSSPGRVAAVIDRPRLSLFAFGPDPQDPSRIRTSIDLAADAISLVAADGADPVDLARRHVWYGVLESALETEAMLQGAAWASPLGRTLAGASLSMGLPLQVLTERGSLPRGAAPALGTALAAGDAVIVPGDPATARTWWTVSPDDGVTRAIVAPGLGGAIASRPLATTQRHDVQGGWTPGGGSYVNSAQNGVRWVINETTLETEGFIRDGRFHRYTRPAPQARTCSGGNEYSQILGCVSIPTAIVLGTVTAVITIFALSRCIRALR